MTSQFPEAGVVGRLKAVRRKINCDVIYYIIRQLAKRSADFCRGKKFLQNGGL